jgi:hypothetical protein
MARSKREPWVCPRCGIEGDHMQTPDPRRCKACCKIDAAEDLYEALANATVVLGAYRGVRVEAAVLDARAALAKARGETP